MKAAPNDKFIGGKIEGLDVISPTWFSVVDQSGKVESRANINYVNNAHELGYQVWALVNNSFDPILSNAVLNNNEVRGNVVNTLVDYAVKYNLDGINIDFENM
jgi:spore germination protein YaaH